MPLTPYTIDRFGPLNLVDDQIEVGATGAVDVVDVTFDERGTVKTRDGFTRLQAISMDTNSVFGLAAYSSILLKQYIVGYTASGTPAYKAYNALTGALVASAAPSSQSISAAQINVGSAQNMYIANGNGGDTIWKWTGSAFSQPAGMPKATYLAVTPVSNRLVMGVVGTNIDRVQFSDPGAPETLTSTSWVDLPYGGGLMSEIQTWQNLVFVFKTSERFFVFTGESTDGTGQPVFNYRAVEGYGAYGAVSGDEGVYFSDGRSIWLTRGDIPTSVSTPIDPFLRGETTLDGGTVDQTQIALHRLSYSLGKLYVSVLLVGGTRRTLVFDPKLPGWTYYSLDMTPVRSLALGLLAAPQTIWLSPSGVDTFDASQTDNGANIGWFYLSGKYPLSDPGRVVITQESSILGWSLNTNIALQLGTDSYGFITSTSSNHGFTAAQENETYAEMDQEGRLFQHALTGVRSGSVSRLTHYISFVKPAGIQ